MVRVSYLPSTHYTTSAMMLAGERFTATAASTQNLLFQMASLIMPIIVGRVIDATGSLFLCMVHLCWMRSGCGILQLSGKK